MDVVGLKHLVAHPDAADAWVFTNQADAPRDLLVPQLEATFGSKPRAHWLRVLQDADVPVAPIQSRDEFFASRFVSENDMSVAIDHPLHGRCVEQGCCRGWMVVCERYVPDPDACTDLLLASQRVNDWGASEADGVPRRRGWACSAVGRAHGHSDC